MAQEVVIAWNGVGMTASTRSRLWHLLTSPLDISETVQRHKLYYDTIKIKFNAKL